MLTRNLYTAGLLLLLCGCQTPQTHRNFFLNEAAIGDIERVVLLPVHAPSVGLSFEGELDRVFLSKLTAVRLFEVVTISREDLVRRFGKRSFNSAEPLKESLFQYAAEASHADAIVIFDLTTYHPYQPIKVGIRGKMIKIDTQEILWAVDELFDSADKTVSKKASKYEQKSQSGFAATSQDGSILVSPMRFTAYAAEQSIETLPETANN